MLTIKTGSHTMEIYSQKQPKKHNQRALSFVWEQGLVFQTEVLEEFGAQNKVTEIVPCFGTKMEFWEPGFGGLQTL